MRTVETIKICDACRIETGGLVPAVATLIYQPGNATRLATRAVDLCNAHIDTVTVADLVAGIFGYRRHPHTAAALPPPPPDNADPIRHPPGRYDREPRDCPHCGGTYQSGRGLGSHIQQKHPGAHIATVTDDGGDRVVDTWPRERKLP